MYLCRKVSCTSTNYIQIIQLIYNYLNRIPAQATITLKEYNIFILETGNILELTNEGCKKGGKVKTGAVFVDGLGVGDVGNIVLRDRRHLAQDGMLTIVVAIDREALIIVSGPDVITRGFVYVKESEELINKVKEISIIEVERCLELGVIEWYVLKSNMKKATENYIYEKTKRRPTIIPIIMET